MREELIEAMATTIQNRVVMELPPSLASEFAGTARRDAEAALDALLVFLTEHADTVVRTGESAKWTLRDEVNLGGIDGLIWLLSADREDAE